MDYLRKTTKVVMKKQLAKTVYGMPENGVSAVLSACAVPVLCALSYTRGCAGAHLPAGVGVTPAANLCDRHQVSNNFFSILPENNRTVCP